MLFMPWVRNVMTLGKPTAPNPCRSYLLAVRRVGTHPAEEAGVVQAVRCGVEAGSELALHLARIIAELRTSAPAGVCIPGAAGCFPSFSFPPAGFSSGQAKPPEGGSVATKALLSGTVSCHSLTDSNIQLTFLSRKPN